MALPTAHNARHWHQWAAAGPLRHPTGCCPHRLHGAPQPALLPTSPPTPAPRLPARAPGGQCAPHTPTVYSVAVLGLVSVLVVRESVTEVPIAGFGAKKPLGISTDTGSCAGSTQPLGSVIVRVWLTGSIAPMAAVQFGSRFS